MDKEKSKQFQLELGSILFDIRRNAGITQKEFAKKYNCHENYISRIELGKIKPPAEAVLWYCKEFNVSPDKIFQHVESRIATDTQKK